MDLVEGEILLAHLVEDAEKMLFSTENAAGDAVFFQKLRYLPDDPFDVRLAQGVVAVQAVADLGVDLGLEILEAQVLELDLDPVQPQAVGQGGVDVHGLLGDQGLLLGLLEVQGAHVVQPSASLTRTTRMSSAMARIILRMFSAGLLLGFEGDLADLGHPVHDVGHFLPEVLLDLVDGGLGVLHGVVQKPGGHRGRVQTQFGQDVGRLQGMGQVGLPRKPGLPGVGCGGKYVGLADQVQVGLGHGVRQPVDDFVYADHRAAGRIGVGRAIAW